MLPVPIIQAPQVCGIHQLLCWLLLSLCLLTVLWVERLSCTVLEDLGSALACMNVKEEAEVCRQEDSSSAEAGNVVLS